MEKSLDTFLSYLEEQFALGKVDLRTYSPLTLAYIGDAVFELVIRTLVVEQGNCPPNKLHKRSSALVKAPAQARMAERLLSGFTQEEEQIYKRGRNAKSYTKAKHATVIDYRKATGLEALMGYLYLQGNLKRAIDLIKLGLSEEQKDES